MLFMTSTIVEKLADTSRRAPRAYRGQSSHPQPHENAWLIGQALMNAGLLPTQLVIGMVGARVVAFSHGADQSVATAFCMLDV
jgi:hypothetical protein